MRLPVLSISLLIAAITMLATLICGLLIPSTTSKSTAKRQTTKTEIRENIDSNRQVSASTILFAE